MKIATLLENISSARISNKLRDCIVKYYSTKIVNAIGIVGEDDVDCYTKFYKFIRSEEFVNGLEVEILKVCKTVEPSISKIILNSTSEISTADAWALHNTFWLRDIPDLSTDSIIVFNFSDLQITEIGNGVEISSISKKIHSSDISEYFIHTIVHELEHIKQFKRNSGRSISFGKMKGISPDKILPVGVELKNQEFQFHATSPAEIQAIGAELASIYISEITLKGTIPNSDILKRYKTFSSFASNFNEDFIMREKGFIFKNLQTGVHFTINDNNPHNSSIMRKLVKHAIKALQSFYYDGEFEDYQQYKNDADKGAIKRSKKGKSHALEKLYKQLNSGVQFSYGRVRRFITGNLDSGELITMVGEIIEAAINTRSSIGISVKPQNGNVLKFSVGAASVQLDLTKLLKVILKFKNLNDDIGIDDESRIEFIHEFHETLNSILAHHQH